MQSQFPPSVQKSSPLPTASRPSPPNFQQHTSGRGGGWSAVRVAGGELVLAGAESSGMRQPAVYVCRTCFHSIHLHGTIFIWDIFSLNWEEIEVNLCFTLLTCLRLDIFSSLYIVSQCVRSRACVRAFSPALCLSFTPWLPSPSVKPKCYVN